MTTANNLLTQVNLISKKYEAITEITGEDFNIFEILAVETDELSHSRILTKVLAPFLKQFFEKFLPEANANSLDFSKFQVHREYYAKDFGRIDIFINCQDFGIVIENKIYAGDQPEQLKRYNEFLKSKREFKEKSHIFYLTLNGDKANDNSSDGVEYKTLSYKKDILEWLKLCQKEVYNKPIIRETLEQYINLIKILTNQTRSEKMSEDIAKIIASNADNMKSALEIEKNLQKAKEMVFNEKLRDPLIKRIENKHGLEYSNFDWNTFEKGQGTVIPFGKENWEFYIHIALDKFNKFGYGVVGKIDVVKDKFESCGFKYRNDQKNGVCTLLKESSLSENIFAELCKPENKVLDEFEKKIEEVLNLICS